MATVSIEQGLLKGSKCYTDKGREYFEFVCVPYAKPPVGNLRFKSPQPPEPWDGVKDATIEDQGHVACQLDMLKRHYIGSEDCLYLNVYTPKLPNDDDETELLSVMIYLHGGGFLYSYGIIKSEAGPDYLIDNNVIVVSINYRLGIFGFLSLDIPEAAGNMGLKDQVLALKWVQNNINKFGGDKSNVPIFGISAGAASAEYLILYPKCEGLFHKAILQSGSTLNHWAINFEPQKLLQKLLQQLKFEGSAQNHRVVYEFLMTCSSALLTEKSFKVVEESNPENIFFGFVPTIETDFGNGEAFLTASPYKLIKEGKFNKLPIIRGFCEMEGYMMGLDKPSAIEELNKDQNYIKHLAYSAENIDRSNINDRFVEAYINSTNNLSYQDNRSVLDFYGDYDIVSGTWLSARFMSGYGMAVYLYKFSYDGKMNFFKNAFDIRKKGAAHADDVTYIFKLEMSNLADESDIIVRDNVTKLWTNFAKSSNPDRPSPVIEDGDCLAWPLLTETSPKYLNIDKKFTIESYQDASKMDIFEDLYEKYQI